MNDGAAVAGRLGYVELPVAEVARERAFFEQAFEWAFTAYGDGYASSHDGGCELGLVAVDRPGAADSADVAERAMSAALIGVAVADLNRAERAVVAAGGLITMPAFDFPGGRRFEASTPHGHRVALFRYDGDPDAA